MMKPLSLQARADLFAGLATMEQAGLPVDKAIGLLRISGAGQGRVDRMRRLLARGEDLASAGGKSGLFTELETSLVRAAQRAGSPATTYRRLANGYKQQALQAATLRSRMALPVLVLTIGLFVQPLPNLISGALGVGGYLLEALRPLVMLAALVYLTQRFRAWIRPVSPRPAQALMARLTTQLPLFGTMHVRRNTRDFCASLALLLEAGVPMFEALPIALETIENGIIRGELARIESRMKRGATLGQASEGLRYINHPQFSGYVHTGEGSGRLPEMLLRFANAETDAISDFQEQVTTWLPRVVYVLVVTWLAYAISSGSAFMPHVSEALQ